MNVGFQPGSYKECSMNLNSYVHMGHNIYIHIAYNMHDYFCGGFGPYACVMKFRSICILSENELSMLVFHDKICTLKFVSWCKASHVHRAPSVSAVSHDATYAWRICTRERIISYMVYFSRCLHTVHALKVPLRG